MFNSIVGLITEKLPNELIIENQGIEWSLFVSSFALDSFGSLGSEARVFTWLYHREDQMRLFGFYSVHERNLFLDLLKVDGIGPKQAIKILSSITLEELEAALENEDVSKLESAPGIGKKTAQKMILALKGKLTQIDTQSYVKNSPIPEEHADIIAGLMNMGFDKKAVIEAVDRLSKEYKASNPDAKLKTFEQELLRRAIIALSS